MKKRPRVQPIDYTKSFVMPIRDMWTDDMRVVLKVIVYGLEPSDCAVIPGGSEPFHQAIERLGLNPNRYQAVIWDLPIKPSSRVSNYDWRER